MRRVELSAAGVHPQTLARLVHEGTLTRVTRGLYQLGDADITAPHALAEIAKLAPKGVICLVSALQFHELTLQMPSRVWLAIGTKARSPKIDYPPIRVVRFGTQALSLGVEIHSIDGVSVPIFNRPRPWSIAFDSENTSVSMWRSRAFTASRDRTRPNRRRSFNTPATPDLVGSKALSRSGGRRWRVKCGMFRRQCALGSRTSPGRTR